MLQQGISPPKFSIAGETTEYTISVDKNDTENSEISIELGRLINEEQSMNAKTITRDRNAPFIDITEEPNGNYKLVVNQ